MQFARNEITRGRVAYYTSFMTVITAPTLEVSESKTEDSINIFLVGNRAGIP